MRTSPTLSELSLVNPTPRKKTKAYWRAPGGEWQDGLPSAREAKAIGAMIQINDHGGFNKFYVSHKDNWGDERYPWRVSANIVVGTAGAVDAVYGPLNEFATFREAVVDARRRVRERDYSEVA